MPKKKTKELKLSKIEIVEQELTSSEKLLWGEQIHIFTTMTGCLTMVLGLLTLPGVLLVAGGLIFGSFNGFMVGFIWSVFGSLMTWKSLKSTRQITVGLTKEKVIFRKAGNRQIEIPLAQIKEMEVNSYFSGTKEGDLVLRTRYKKLNTKDYKFTVKTHRYTIEKVPNVLEVKQKIEQIQQEYLLKHPDALDKIQIEGENID